MRAKASTNVALFFLYPLLHLIIVRARESVEEHESPTSGVVEKIARDYYAQLFFHDAELYAACTSSAASHCRLYFTLDDEPSEPSPTRRHYSVTANDADGARKFLAATGMLSAEVGEVFGRYADRWNVMCDEELDDSVPPPKLGASIIDASDNVLYRVDFSAQRYNIKVHKMQPSGGAYFRGRFEVEKADKSGAPELDADAEKGFLSPAQTSRQKSAQPIASARMSVAAYKQRQRALTIQGLGCGGSEKLMTSKSALKLGGRSQVLARANGLRAANPLRHALHF